MDSLISTDWLKDYDPLFDLFDQEMHQTPGMGSSQHFVGDYFGEYDLNSYCNKQPVDELSFMLSLEWLGDQSNSNALKKRRKCVKTKGTSLLAQPSGLQSPTSPMGMHQQQPISSIQSHHHYQEQQHKQILTNKIQSSTVTSSNGYKSEPKTSAPSDANSPKVSCENNFQPTLIPAGLSVSNSPLSTLLIFKNVNSNATATSASTTYSNNRHTHQNLSQNRSQGQKLSAIGNPSLITALSVTSHVAATPNSISSLSPYSSYSNSSCSSTFSASQSSMSPSLISNPTSPVDVSRQSNQRYCIQVEHAYSLAPMCS